MLEEPDDIKIRFEMLVNLKFFSVTPLNVWFQEGVVCDCVPKTHQRLSEFPFSYQV